MPSPAQAHALELKRLADQRVQIDASDDHVASQNAGRFLHVRKSRAETVENLL